ncbi:GNAT family N-acetyltransferase [Streptomyces sp. NPDC000151]|uniref:GNAT family N-acetyltransferase n=1 Tax=Streptomyces sp. NPDC000151 TaxID=3154244 RepID=UPI00331AC915
MTLLFLFPGDPLQPGRPDPDFACEARAAGAAGARVAVVDHEALLAGNATRAVAGVPAGPGPVRYRGRPLPAGRGAELAAALADRDRTLLTDEERTDGLGPVTDDAEAARLFEALVAAASGFPLALTAGRVTLRALPPAECARLTDGGTAGLTWVDGAPPEGTVEGAGIMVRLAAAGLYRPGWGTYAITRTEDGVALGGIGFHGPPDEAGTVELGYDLSPSARGAGWATDAVRLLASWAAARPEVGTLVATTEPANVPSQRVLERAGFVRAGERSGMYAFEYAGSGNGGTTDADGALSAGTRPPS